MTSSTVGVLIRLGCGEIAGGQQQNGIRRRLDQAMVRRHDGVSSDVLCVWWMRLNELRSGAVAIHVTVIRVCQWRESMTVALPVEAMREPVEDRGCMTDGLHVWRIGKHEGLRGVEATV